MDIEWFLHEINLKMRKKDNNIKKLTPLPLGRNRDRIKPSL